MLKVNGIEIENAKFNGVDLNKVVINGVTVFEKNKENTIIMRTLNDNVKLSVVTKYHTSCEVWNAGTKIGVLHSYGGSTILSIPNKNEDVIIRGIGIKEFYCSFSAITSLNIQNCPDLEALDCSRNLLETLNVQEAPALRILSCLENKLISLNLHGLTKLQTLGCSFNRLTDLNVKDCALLYHLDCSANRLTSLNNVEGLVRLYYLDCKSNRLTSLNVSGCKALVGLHCSLNQITSLNVQDCPLLNFLACCNNHISSSMFRNILSVLPNNSYGRAVLYNILANPEQNYQDFTRPPELVQALNAAKARGWKFYKSVHLSDYYLI
ncbi:hypothetical protein V1L52_10015 [Treponema sp. HNW]|uniref:leucine-rich repeat domain-containing protein n=1 Tax=Treponema sp. HNW TaxID=3116654 RepID=UPI003D12CDFA